MLHKFGYKETMQRVKDYKEFGYVVRGEMFCGHGTRWWCDYLGLDYKNVRQLKHKHNLTLQELVLGVKL